jgi:DNA repair exonuclease SbcCD nuclease subunit
MLFVHAADLHIDSPLRGLEHYVGAPVERIRLATRAALENLVRLCLEEQVDFLVVAGDLFDYDWRDFSTALFVVKQFQLLEQAKIPVFIIRGNHDSREEMSRKVPWPRNVTLFDHAAPQTIVLDQLGVALHGMSFPKREVKENLVPRYPPRHAELFNLGLLHTNATGNTEHDPYAPCSLEELIAKGYDYWALGHLHDFEVLHVRPHVVYSGNTQGRHVREQGPKGCVLVEVEDTEVTGYEFRHTDVLRWFRVPIVLGTGDGLDELVDLARVRLREIAQQADGRLAAVRMEISGRCEAHRALVRESSRQEMLAQLRSLPGELTDDLWVEKIKLATALPLDRDALKQGQDLVGDLVRSFDATAADDARLKELSTLLRPLGIKVGVELVNDEVDFSDRVQLCRWLQDAEADLLSRLTEGLE